MIYSGWKNFKKLFGSFVSNLNNLLSDFSSVNWFLWDVAANEKTVPGSSSSPFLYTFYHCSLFCGHKPWFCFSCCSPFTGLELGTSVLVLPATCWCLFCILATIHPFVGMHRSCVCRIRAMPSKPGAVHVGWVRIAWGLAHLVWGK